ncbi:MAG: flagellin [Planctomycetota bacterium]|nr:flagellin [Planctomycetota bacterium]
MARINTNVSSLLAQHNLQRTDNDLRMRLQRLSTGLRINRGADDPAGLIVSERLRSELKGIDQAIDNSERTSSVIATMEGYLAEVNDLLNSVKSLIIQSANTGGISQDEIEANQLQVDSAIESITRISNTASFAGLRLLDGSLEYLTSGINNSNIINADIHGAQFGNNSNIQLDVEVIASAQTATLFLSAITGTLTSSVTLEIAGKEGVQILSFASGTQVSSVVKAINTLNDSTGVSASLYNGADDTSGLVFNSRSYGSDSFISVKRISTGGTFFNLYDDKGTATVKTRDSGRDVIAMINGTIASGKGVIAKLNTPSLALELQLSDAFATTVSGTSTSFYITGGGAEFQLGPTVNETQQVNFGVNSIGASRLGSTLIGNAQYFLNSIKTGGDNSLVDGRSQQASDVLESAINDISVLRGRLGAFERNTIQTNIRSLQVGLENITAAESKIRDADFASETAKLTRAQILSQAGTSVLALANTSAQNVLALLG